MFEYLFLDLDDTILDFHKAERIAVGKTLATFGVDPTEEVCARYSQINKLHWQMLERGEITRRQVVVGRFAMLFQELDVDGDPALCAQRYEELLSQGHYFMPGALEAVRKLSKSYRLFLASNGTAKVQAGRLKSAGIGPYFEKIFISQEIGADKPFPAYFERCFAAIDGFRRDRAMMVGDSLTSDILGGKNAGIATCWVNPGHGAPRPDIVPDYQIGALSELTDLLDRLNASVTAAP